MGTAYEQATAILLLLAFVIGPATSERHALKHIGSSNCIGNRELTLRGSHHTHQTD
jgi:hypothetical protein